MELIEYPDAEMMMMNLGNTLAGEVRQALAQQDTVTIAVPGGTTPGPIFDALAAVDLDWARVRVMLTDERWVPETSPRSNTRLVRARLLTGRAAAATLVPLYIDAPTPEECLPDLSAQIAAALPLRLALLGMGEDMHTASLFPGADRLHEGLTGDAVVLPMRAPGVEEPRVTLTAQVLRGALSRHIVIIGAAKRAALERARSLSAEQAPVAAILNGSIIHWAES